MKRGQREKQQGGRKSAFTSQDEGYKDTKTPERMSPSREGQSWRREKEGGTRKEYAQPLTLGYLAWCPAHNLRSMRTNTWSKVWLFHTSISAPHRRGFPECTIRVAQRQEAGDRGQKASSESSKLTQSLTPRHRGKEYPREETYHGG